MAIKKLIQTQVLPISLEEAWKFFSTPQNLNAITPENMSFEITNEVGDEIYEGMFITYKIAPMLNIKLDWCTEISHVKYQEFFVDEQRSGPYKIWHHEHHFKAVEGGVEMTDKLYYDIGKSFLGWFAGVLFVHKKVKNIFDFRYQKLTKFFASK